MSEKKRFVVHGIMQCGDGKARITLGDNFAVQGGTKECHQQMTELTREVAKECKKDYPQTPGEFRMIVRDAEKKTGLRR